MGYPFSFTTKTCLVCAGWYPGRTIRTDHWEALLKAAGNPVHPAVVAFLREFGGLTVNHPHQIVTGKLDFFRINPSSAAHYRGIEDDGLYDYNDHVGKALCAIGMACRDYMLLLMAEDGSVYAAIDDLMYFMGNSGPEAIEHLCAGGRSPQVPPPAAR